EGAVPVRHALGLASAPPVSDAKGSAPSWSRDGGWGAEPEALADDGCLLCPWVEPWSIDAGKG
ncbi:MAG: hypothetical protein IKG22_05415, partial [Atopobiaceae bacterium]|nr:hypothetical protein [Atopobiaceae bacterium]